MSRRVGLPGASELFRQTSPEPAEVTAAVPDRHKDRSGVPERSLEATGRVRHDEKITVYVSNDELLALERLRLELRAEHGIAVDRGRIVRAAIAEALADVTVRGADSAILTRLTRS